MSRSMLTLTGWQRVSCAVADVMRASNPPSTGPKPKGAASD